MGLFGNNFNKEGPGISKDTPGKKGIALFFEIFIREFWQLIKLNLLFIIVCIPIVTIFPAIGAMTYVIMKMVRDQPSFVWYDFWEGFKKNWKYSYLVGIIGLLVSISVVSSFYIAIIQKIEIFYAVGVALNIFVGLFLLNVFPMIVTVDLKIIPAIKNSLFLGISCLNHVLPALILTEAIVIACLLLFPLSFPIMLFIMFSLNSFISCFAAWAGIKKYVIKE